MICFNFPSVLPHYEIYWQVCVCMFVCAERKKRGEKTVLSEHKMGGRSDV